MEFTNDPPTNPVLPLQLLRAKPNKPLDCKLCNRTYVGLDTHYIGGATRACLKLPDCAGCKEGMAARWQGYVIVQSTSGNKFALLQFTPIVGLTLRKISTGTTGLLGICIRLTRLGPRRNSPLDCQTIGYDAECAEWSLRRLERIVQALFPDNWREKELKASHLGSLTLENE